MRKIVQVIVVTMSTFVVVAQADVQSDLQNFVNSVGGASSTTPANIYKGQARNYITGGRLFVRMPQRSVQPITYRAPKLTAGCGGIDLYGGNLSFISATELVNTLKAIGSSGASYALMLGLRTISSQIANTIEKMNDWLQENIGMSMNSCEMAANALGALGGAMGINDTEKNVCIIQAMEASSMDWNEAKVACGIEGGAKESMTSDEAKERGFTNGNLAWMIMDEGGIFNADTDMKQMAMSITGTIVKRQVKDVSGVETTVSGDVDSQTKSEVYPSLLLSDSGLLDSLLYGSTVARYRCNDSTSTKFGCLELSKQSWTIAAPDSLVRRTRTALMNLYNHIQNRTDPTTADINYVADTSIPAMRIVKTAALLSDNDLGIQIIDDYAEQIAIELLYTYVNSIANSISGHTFEASYGDDGDKLREGIELAKSTLATVRQEAQINTTRSLQIAEQMQYYERIIISAMPQNIARSLAWSTGSR